ncbi:MAG: hypothetical protein QW271_02755 [Sulfolobales archaeon]
MGICMLVRKKLRRGISELVIILALVAIVIPIVMVVQGWLSSRAGSLENMNVIQPLSGYLVSRSYTNGEEVITIGIRNQGQTSYNVTKFKAILANGAVVDAREASGGGQVILNPSSEKILVITVTTGATRVRGLIIVASEVATNKQIEIPINLG